MEEQPQQDLDMVSLLVHIIDKFGPFTEPVDEFLDGIVLNDGAYRIVVTTDDDGNMVIDTETVV